MDWITALLAFATTMLFFSVVVSTLVELLHRILRMREAGLHRMLRNYYVRVVSASLLPTDPWHPQAAAPASGDRTAAAFANVITGNRAIAQVTGSVGLGMLGRLGEGLSSWIDWGTNASRVSHIPVEVFMEKLAASGVFDKAKFDGDAGKEVLQDLGQKFVAFGSEMSEAFERQARVFSIIIAFGVAFYFYVHPYRLAVAYLGDPTLAENVAALHEDLIAKQKELEEQAKVGFSEAEEDDSSADEPPAPTGGENGAGTQGAPAPGAATPPAAPTQPSSQSTGSDDTPSDAEMARKEVDRIMKDIDVTLDRIKADVRKVTDLGVPIGWPSEDERKLLRRCKVPGDAAGPAGTDADNKPADASATTAREPADAKAGLRSDLDSFCLDENGGVRASWGSWFWLVLGGLLIGLGSPFWVKMIHAITPMKDVAGKIGEVLGTDGRKQAAPHTGGPAPSTAVEAFRASARRGPT
ncbi:MAG: hypothetical protein KF694_11845 [Mesorhizobium sp.]|nr:hypothetical protein [Mesorhizobium sp.]